MKKKFNFNKDESKEYQDDWENLKVGDIVFADSGDSHVSGGFIYGIGQKVTHIIDSKIKTVSESGSVSSWNKETRKALKNNLENLAAFQSR